jgi:hypothetical protein
MKYEKVKMMAKSFVLTLLFLLVPFALQAQDNPQEKPKTDKPPVETDNPPVQKDNPPVQKEKQKESMQKVNEKYSQTATELSKDLASTLKLNEAQTMQVQNILIGYQTDVIDKKKDMNESVASVNKSIENVLQAEQKTSWTSAKEDFWKKVNARVQTSPKKMEEDIN